MLAALQVVVIGFASVPDNTGTVPNVDCRTSTPFDHEVYGKGYVVCDLCGEAQRVYVEMSADTFKDLADYRAGSDFSVDVPGDCAPYKHVYLSYAVGSMHPPWDGRQFLGGSPGGYGQPHVDVHFSTLSVTERIVKTLMLLKRELELSKLQSEISKQVEDKMSANQRRYMLMEQLKHIKKELGESAQVEARPAPSRDLPEPRAMRVLRCECCDASAAPVS